jgi:hypothetical protein
MGGFGGGGNAVKGISPKTNERQQRLTEALSLQGASGAADQQAIANFLIGGGPFQGVTINSSGRLIPGNFQQEPTGPAFNLVNQGLRGEDVLSQLRQGLAQNALQSAPQNDLLNRQFQQGATQQGMEALGLSGGLRNLNALGTFGGNLGLNQQITGDLANFFGSGGAASEAQAGNIGNVFDAQRQIAASNLGQQFDERLRQATDSFSNRGLRNTDTPAQELLGRTVDEFGRQATNTEAALSSQQANALLNQPLLQAQLGGQLQGQSQNNLLNLINSFSQPITQGFNSGNALNSLNQFGLTYTPASQAGPALQNFGALLGGTNPAPNQPVFNPAGIAQNPSFGQKFGSSLASTLGSGLGNAASLGISNLLPGPSTSPPQVNPATASQFSAQNFGAAGVHGPPPSSSTVKPF